MVTRSHLELRFVALMDSEILSFQGTGPTSVASLPPRQVTSMLSQPIVPWTPQRVTIALLAWVLEETQIPVPNDA
jgi:hypothetical protein